MRQVEFGLRRDPRGAAGTLQSHVRREGGAHQQAHHQLQKGDHPGVPLTRHYRLHQAFLFVCSFIFSNRWLLIYHFHPFSFTSESGSLWAKPPHYMQICVRGEINDVNECEEWALD